MSVKKIIMSLIALLFLLYVPGYSLEDEKQPVKLGILFDSNMFEIPDDISDIVTNIFGSALSNTSSIDIVTPKQIETIGYNLGFNKSQFSNVNNATIIGQQANIQYMLLTSINYDLKKAYKTYAKRGLSRIIRIGKQPSTKNIKPTFDVKLVDVATESVITEVKEEIDAFKELMKQQIITGALSRTGLIDLNTLAIAEFATKISPEIQDVINENMKVASVVPTTPDTEVGDKTPLHSSDDVSIAVDVIEKVVEKDTKSSIMEKKFSNESHAAPAAPTEKSSILVNQPAYHNMNFHVYKPADIPSEYYVTYDGYLVYKTDKGIWCYASKDSRGITKTNYVVGSVIPSVVKLNPYDKTRASVAPIKGSAIEERSNKGKIVIPTTPTKTTVISETTKTETPRQELTIILNPTSTTASNYVPQSGENTIVILGANAPDWASDPNFMAISKWQKNIDRIGILDNPKIPIAWKGDYTEVIYAWTGQQWRQLSVNGRKLTALSIIRQKSHDLIRYIRKTNNTWIWYDEDNSILAQYARMWGYKWLGLVVTEKEY